MSVRAASTATTGGVGNPVVSTVEDGIAAGGGILAFVAPVAVAIVALLLSIALFRAGRKAYRRLRPKPG
jgi:fumarate reductase subunit D